MEGTLEIHFMKMDKYIKTIILVGVAWLVCLSVFTILAFPMEFELAVYSYKLSCLTPYKINEETTSGFVDYKTGNITIYEEFGTPEYEEIMVHENCHLKQIEEGRMHSCLNFIGRIINEFECYKKQIEFVNEYG